MKERILDIVKWGFILIIAGAVFYVVYPKYYFYNSAPGLWSRGNMMTGKVEVCIGVRDNWQELGKHKNTNVFAVPWTTPTPRDWTWKNGLSSVTE